MALGVNTNFYATTAHRNLSLAQSTLAKSVDRLSSGVRINAAADDASGLAMADKLRGQIGGLSKGMINAQDAVSYLQTVEGGMETMSEMIQRMRELAVQAGNGTYTTDDRRELQKEVDQLKVEIDRIATATEYNTRKLLNGDASGLWGTDSVEIEAIIKGTPAEGNYRINVDVDPGTNTVYKTNVMVNQGIIADVLGRNAEIVYTDIEPTATNVDTRWYQSYVPEVPATRISGVTNLTSMDYADTENIIKALYNGRNTAPDWQTRRMLDVDTVSNQSAGAIAGKLAGAGYSDINPANVTAAGTVNFKFYGYSSNTGGETRLQGEYDDFIGIASNNMDYANGTLVFERNTAVTALETMCKFYSNDGSTVVTLAMTTASDTIQFGSIDTMRITMTDKSLSALTTLTIPGNYNDKLVLQVFGWDGSTSAMSEVNYHVTAGNTLAPVFGQNRFVAPIVTGGTAEVNGLEVVNGNITTYSVTLQGVPSTGNSNAHVDYIGRQPAINEAKAYRVIRDGMANRDPSAMNPIGDWNGINQQTAVNAGIKGLMANGEGAELFDGALAFQANRSAFDFDFLSAYSGPANMGAGFLESDATVLKGMVNNVYSNQSDGYLEVEFLAANDLTDGNQVAAKFTFIDAATGDHYAIEFPVTVENPATDPAPPANRNLLFRVGETVRLDFRNRDGHTVALNFTVPSGASALGGVSDGDKLLYTIRSTNNTKQPDDTYAVLTIPGENGAMQTGPTILLKDGKTDSKTITGVVLEYGKFKEVNLHWDVEDTGVVEGNAVTLSRYRFPDDGLPRTLSEVQLKYLPPFTTADGRLSIENTRTIGIYGNDRQTEITLEGNDSVQDFVDKLSSALIRDLDMGATGVRGSDLVKFVTAVGTGDFSVLGTIVIQTAMLGAQSELKFSGDEAVLNALGITQLRHAEESNAVVTVHEAHTGTLIGSDVVSDRMLRGVINGVDLKVDSRAGVNVYFDEGTSRLVFKPVEDKESMYLHVVDSRAEIQMGANEGQRLNISVARLDSQSLEISDTYVMTIEDSQRAITKLDQALEKIAHARASTGAQINRIEYAMKNINISRQSLVTAESRIRDLDVAEESATFTQNQILVNAATAIMAQANQLPQTASQLIGGR